MTELEIIMFFFFLTSHITKGNEVTCILFYFVFLSRFLYIDYGSVDPCCSSKQK